MAPVTVQWELKLFLTSVRSGSETLIKIVKQLDLGEKKLLKGVWGVRR